MTNSKKILVVEDDKFLRKVYESKLPREGYSIVSAINGEEGINFMKKTQFDLVLLDLIMPKMGGMEFLDALKKMGGNKIPILISSQLSKMEDISKAIDFELFRAILEEKLLNTSKKSNAGAKPFDVVLMFKITLIQRYSNLSDNQVEYQIVDRMSFKRFLGLETGDKVPDENTIWLFRENLTQKAVVEDLL